MASEAVFVWACDADLLCTYVDQAVLDLTGRTMGEELGVGWVDGIHPDDRASLVAKFEAAASDRAVFTNEYRLRTRGGEYRWIQVHGAPSLDAGGRILGFKGTGIDVTARRCAEDARHRQAGDSSSLDPVSDDSASLRTPEAAIRATLEQLRAQFPGKRPSYYLLRPSGVIECIDSLSADGLPAIDGSSFDLSEHPEFLDALRATGIAVVGDLLTRLMTLYPGRVVPEGMPAASIEVVVDRAGEDLLCVCLDGAEAHRWLDDEIAAVKRAADLLAVALRSAVAVAERDRAEGALGEARSRFEAVFNNSVQFLGLTTPDGTLVEVNETGLQFAGVRREDVVGLPVWDSPWFREDPELRELIRAACASACDGKVVRNVLTMTGATGVTLPMDFCIKPILDESGAVRWVLGEAHEISALKQTEAALRTSEANWRAIVETAPAIITMIDRDGRILFNNKSHHIVNSADMVGMNVFDMVTPDLRTKFEAAVRAVFTNGHTGAYEGGGSYDPDGRWFSCRIGPVIRDGEVVAATLVSTDVTDRKRNEERLQQYRDELQALAGEIPMAQERERRRIAADLHDSTVQNLGILRVKLGALRGLMRERIDDAEVLAATDDVVTLAEDTIADTRSVLYDLSPPILYELGFEPAVEWLAEKTADQYGIDCEVHAFDTSYDLSDEAKVVLFQTVRELLLNVCKHANAGKAVIRLECNDGDLAIGVEDDGVGFDPARVKADQSKNGFGLLGVREGLRLIEGTLSIEAGGGGGTVAKVAAPLRRVASEVSADVG